MLQDSEFLKPRSPTSNMGERNISTMPSPKKLTQQAINGLAPPPPRSMPPPPPKFNFNSTPPVMKLPEDSHVRSKTKSEAVPDTLVQLMEYGDDDEDDDDVDYK